MDHSGKPSIDGGPARIRTGVRTNFIDFYRQLITLFIHELVVGVNCFSLQLGKNSSRHLPQQ
jgi:hypothetical protein